MGNPASKGPILFREITGRIAAWIFLQRNGHAGNDLKNIAIQEMA